MKSLFLHTAQSLYRTLILGSVSFMIKGWNPSCDERLSRVNHELT
jgi:hypothetical protein